MSTSPGWRLSLSVLAFLAFAAPAAAFPPAEPVAMRAEGRVFDAPATLEVRGLDRESARRALAAAWESLQNAERELSDLTRASGAGAPRPVPPRLFPLLERADDFCRWSDAAVSPLAGQVFALWGLREPAGGLPNPDRLEEAVALARCERWRLDASAGTMTIETGATLDLWSFERGWGVDQAIEALDAAGARDARVRIGEVVRAMGDGPTGRGWRQEITLSNNSDEPREQILLQGQSLAVASASERELAIGGERFAPYLDLRTGRPARGVARTAAVTELALDAQALSAAMFVFGPSAGALRMGVLRPKPSVLWVLGEGKGAPVLSTANWTAVKRP